jgi:hypothetical protein
MKKATVTGALKSILKDLKLEEQYYISYSDKRANGKVGVKFSGLFLNEKQKEVIKTEMEKLGFEFYSFKDNINEFNRYGGWSNGVRCTFYKQK